MNRTKIKIKKRSTVNICDSLTRYIRGKKLAERVGNQKVFVKTYGGAKIGDIKYHAIPPMEYQPNQVILHVGTNEVRTKIEKPEGPSALQPTTESQNQELK